MNFNEYQKKAWETAIYPNKGNNIAYPALGLGGESGEVLEKIKKIMRDEKSGTADEKKEEIKKEIGDVLWYLAALSTEFKLDLDDIAKKNIEKLHSRKKRNQLHGSGDNR
mgnify:FL=1